MLHDHRMASITDFPKLYEPFPNVKIRGGISYFLWARDHDGPCAFRTMMDGKPVGATVERYLDENDVLIRWNDAVPILAKVRAKGEPTLDARVSANKPFGWRTFYHGAASPKGMSDPVKLYGSQRVTWVERGSIPQNAEWVSDWKVLMTAVQGTSAAIERQFLSRPIVAGPGSACTETYLVAGRFASEAEAQSYASYLRTRFVRFLVSLRKSTQHAACDVYAYVPDLIYDHEYTDAELYDRYGLTEAEHAFIETIINPLD